MAFADLVKDGLKRKNMKAPELAEVIGVAASTIYRVLNEDATPGADIAARIAHALELNPDAVHRALLGEPGTTPAARSPDEILRELQEAMRFAAPIELPLVEQRAAAGYLGGGVADVETLTYLPVAGERGHSLIAIRVSGDCLEPRLMDGHIAIVDMSITAKPGDVVLALHEGEAILKELRERDGRPVLVALRRRPVIPVNEDTRIVGVVIGAQYKP